MRKILLIGTGSVAIWKFDKLNKLLQESGFDVKCMVSDYVKENYSELKSDTIDMDTNLNSYPAHIQWVKDVDLILVAPATANTLAKFNAGIADSPLLATLLAARNPIIFAPAMNTFMYKAIEDRGIINSISKLGHIFIPPTVGKLREEEIGLGRMEEPENIVQMVKNYFTAKKEKVLIVNGASKMWIDPVRYITTPSTGQMGRMLSNSLRLLGYETEMIEVSHLSNEEILKEIKTKDFNFYISTAAINDLKVNYSPVKIKKGSISEIKLDTNIDILSEVSKMDKKIIGFKLDDDSNRAWAKQTDLKLYGMVWNKISTIGSNFSSGEIRINNKKIKFNNISKMELSKLISKNIQ